MENVGHSLACPVPPAIGGSTAVLGSGRGQVFTIETDAPVSAYECAIASPDERLGQELRRGRSQDRELLDRNRPASAPRADARTSPSPAPARSPAGSLWERAADYEVDELDLVRGGLQERASGLASPADASASDAWLDLEVHSMVYDGRDARPVARRGRVRTLSRSQLTGSHTAHSVGRCPAPRSRLVGVVDHRR
jgi:hypothetical protein